MKDARLRTSLIAIAALLAAACGAPAQQEFGRADSDAIRKNAIAFTEAFNAKAIDKVLEFYNENSVFMPPNKPLLRGREPLKSFYDELMSRGATNLQMEPVDIAGHGPLAYESGTYSINYDKGVRDRGKYLRIHRNMNGAWKTEYTVWSSDLPPAPAGEISNR